VKAKTYEIIEHTADIGIRVEAKDLKGIFVNSAQAIFEIIAEPKPAKNQILKKFQINQEAANLQELFINWLNELLSLASAKEVVFSQFQIIKLDYNSLEAVAAGRAAENYRINKEIKAATHHRLIIRKTRAGWLAEIIFDV
jgi:SHS2 domain-containing protein